MSPLVSRIMFLCRDGVGDGQINYVLDMTSRPMRIASNQADLKFTYIIVSKRINTRFFR